METPIKNSTERCLRKRRRKRNLKLLIEDAKSPSRNLGTKKPIKKLKNSENIKKISKQYLTSFQNLFKEHMSLNTSQNKEPSKTCDKVNAFDQTIDLCDTDGSVDNRSLNVSSQKSVEVVENVEPVIDLCQDTCERNEIIDLTETVSVPCVNFNENSGAEPTVIDISKDDSTYDSSFKKSENDDIFVIGIFNKIPDLKKKNEPSFISLSNKWNTFSSLISCKEKLSKKHKKRLLLDKIDNKNINRHKKDFKEIIRSLDEDAKIAKVGGNIYVNSPVTLPSKGLRPIIIDGSNVAFVHSNCNFSCKRLQICINYFKEKGHKVTAFVPQFRMSSHRNDNPQLLRKLERQGDVVLTPSKKIDGRNIVPYDDRFIVQTAVLKGGIIVSRDNYNDLLKENPAWAETIKYRTLAFTWVDDVLMFPKDPLGEHGPTLEDFLRFH